MRSKGLEGWRGARVRAWAGEEANEEVGERGWRAYAYVCSARVRQCPKKIRAPTPPESPGILLSLSLFVLSCVGVGYLLTIYGAEGEVKRRGALCIGLCH